MERYEKYIVKLVRPYGVTHRQMEQYIEDALSSYKDGLRMDDPLLALDEDTISVSSA